MSTLLNIIAGAAVLYHMTQRAALKFFSYQFFTQLYELLYSTVYIYTQYDVPNLKKKSAQIILYEEWEYIKREILCGYEDLSALFIYKCFRWQIYT